MPSKITLPREFLVTLIALVWVIFIATVKTVIPWEVIIRPSKKSVAMCYTIFKKDVIHHVS